MTPADEAPRSSGPGETGLGSSRRVGLAGCRTAVGEELPGTVAAVVPPHVVRLAADAFDECRRRVQHGASGRRGRKDEPLHQARSALRTGAGSFTGKARLQALFADERHPGVEVTGHPPADGAAHRGPGTLVMRSDQALEREEPVRRSMRALLTNHEILVAFPGQHLHVSCAARSSPPGPHQPPPSWPYRCRDVSHCFERWGEKATSGAWDVGRARGRGSGPGPCRVFVGAGRARDHGPLTDGGRAANLLFYPDSSQSC